MHPTTLSLSSYRQAARSLGAKSAGAIAAGAGLLAASPAQAQMTGIHAYTLTSGNTAVAGSSPYVFFNFLADQLHEQVSNSDVAGRMGYVYVDRSRSYIRDSGSGIDFLVTNTVNHRYTEESYYAATPLILGASVNGGGMFNFKGTFNVYPGDPSVVWNNSSAYIGFRIDAGSGDFFYGWAKITSGDQYATTVTINSFGVNYDPNGAITAGQTTAVPEPAASATLLALGAAGLVAYRRRKNLSRATA